MTTNTPHQFAAVQRIMRSMAAGADAGRLLQESLAGAVDTAHAANGVVFAVMDGLTTPLAATGPVDRILIEAADAAIATGRMSRKRSRDGHSHAAAQPLRISGRMVGALAVVRTGAYPDVSGLPIMADAAAMAMSRRPAGGASGVEVLDAVAGVAVDLDRSSVMVRTLDAAERLFGSLGGFIALQEHDQRLVIAYERNVDRDVLRDAARHPDFRTFVTGSEVRFDPPTHPIVSMLARGTETAVGLPLAVGGRRLGHLLLMLGDEPDAQGKVLLRSFADHVAITLRSADLHRRIGDKEEQLASIVHCMPNPVLVADNDGRFVTVNGAASELFRLSGAFEAGQAVSGRLGHPELEQLITAGAGGDAEVALGDEPAVYRATARIVHTSTGRVLGRVLVLDDISKARAVDQVRSDFVAVVGHELRTPLTVLKGYLGTLQMKGRTLDDATRAQVVDALAKNTDRLTRLVEDLLLVSGLEGRPAEPVDVHVGDLGTLMDELASDRVVVKRPEALVATADHDRVRKVLQHLVDNALKYSEDEVTVEAFDRGRLVEIAVEDRGDGIFSGDIPQLFERFHQLDASSTRAHGGTGLGLYVCRRLVELMGGRIWCESRLGAGSRFAFTLPKEPLRRAASPGGAFRATVAPEPAVAVGQSGVKLDIVRPGAFGHPGTS